MAAGLVHLEGQLSGSQNDGHGPPGTLRGSQQGYCFLADAPGATGQVHGFDELVAARALVAAEGVGIGALLHLVLAYSRGLQARPALDDLLLNKGALRAGKGLVFTEEGHVAFGHLYPLRAAHGSIGRQEKLDFLLQRDLKRIHLHWRAVSGDVNHRWPQVHVLGLDQGAGFGDLDGQGGHPVHLGWFQVGAGGKAPGTVNDHPHAEALVLRAGEGLHHPVLDSDALTLQPHDADVGITSALNLSQVQSAVG